MHDYGEIAARHYAAYRPPLHAEILREALGDQRFDKGVDVGCGAGSSAVALARHCRRVIGVDPSEAMLAAAIAHPKVAYRLGDAAALPVAAQEADLVSAAGVLPYVDRDAFRSELRRVCRPAATILVYDFRIELREIIMGLTRAAPPASSRYDHAATLSNDAAFETLRAGSERRSLRVDARQATHLLLASEARSRFFTEVLAVADPALRIEEMLSGAGPGLDLEATIWFAAHRFR